MDDDVAGFRKVTDTEAVVLMVKLRNRAVEYRTPAWLGNRTLADVMTGREFAFGSRSTLEAFQTHAFR